MRVFFHNKPLKFIGVRLGEIHVICVEFFAAENNHRMLAFMGKYRLPKFNMLPKRSIVKQSVFYCEYLGQRKC